MLAFIFATLFYMLVDVGYTPLQAFAVMAGIVVVCGLIFVLIANRAYRSGAVPLAPKRPLSDFLEDGKNVSSVSAPESQSKANDALKLAEESAAIARSIADNKE